MQATKQILKLILGVFAFILIWAALLILSPLMIAFILGQTAFQTVFKKKLDNKKLPPYILAAKENSEYPHSAN